MIRNLLVPALALSGLATTPAAAEEHVWHTGTGFTIRAGDLDLAARQGREALLRRIDFAAAQLCREVTPRVDRRDCAARLTEAALASAPQTLRTAVTVARLEQNAARLAGR